MTSSLRLPFRLFHPGLLLSFTASAWAQETAPAARPAEPAPAIAVAPAEPAVASPAAPAAPASNAAPPATAAEPPLRRLDGPDAPAAPEPSPAPPRPRVRRSQNEFPVGHHFVPKDTVVYDLVSVMGSTTVEGRVERDAVAVLGSTVIRPGARVGGAAVAVMGRLESRGAVGRDTVSVMGASRIDGPVGGKVVVVLGSLTLGPSAVVEGDLVVIGGGLTRDPAAIVRGSEVHLSIFDGLGDMSGLVAWVKKALVFGRPLAIGGDVAWVWLVAFSFLGLYLLIALLFPRGIRACVTTLETRPGYTVLASFLGMLLTPVALVILAVTVVGALLVPFFLIALLAAKLVGMAAMLAWIGRQFTRFFGDGPLGHPVFAVLVGGAITALLYLIPVIGFLVFALLHWLGFGLAVYTVRRTLRRERRADDVDRTHDGGTSPSPGPGPVPPRAPTVPVRPSPTPGAVAMGVASLPRMSAGFSETAAEGNARESAPVAPVPLTTTEPASPSPSPGMVPPVATPAAVAESVSAPQPVPPVENAVPPPPLPPVPPVPPFRASAPIPPPPVPANVPEAAWPRAGFFIRLGALAIDGVLIGMIMALVAGILPRAVQFHNGPGGWLVALAIYGALMWRHKGTTIGGIVCGLKVVRTDQREVDWATAIVRALGCFLSLAVAGLGFLWVAFDDEKLSWHDKIAGTTVVLVPKSASLI